MSLIALAAVLFISSSIAMGQPPRRAPARQTPQGSQPSEAERLLWQEVIKRDTKDAYDFYLREFPQGAYTRLAKTKLTEIADRAEKAKWDAALATNTRESFQAYLREFPNGRYSADATGRIRKINREEEDALWKETDRKDDVAAYNEYLRKYPSGVYARVARLRLSALGAPYTNRVSRQGDGSGQGVGSGMGSGPRVGTGQGVGIGPRRGGGDGAGIGNSPNDGPPTTIRRGETVGVKILSQPRATYTDIAREAGIQGKVVLRVTLQADGTVGAISAVSGLPHGLTEKAMEAARRVRFEPAKRNGVPYTVTRTLEYSFTIY